MCCLVICSVTIGAISIISVGTILSDNSETIMQLLSSTSSQKIDKLFMSIEQSINTCYDFSVEKLSDISVFVKNTDQLNSFNDSIGSLLKNVVSNTDCAISGYIRYNPDILKDDIGIFYVKDTDTGKISEFPLTNIKSYDKNDKEHVGWYYTPIENKKPTWMPPYINKNIGDIYMTSYIIPIFDKSNNPIAIIGMDIDMSQIISMVDEIRLYDTGYAFLCNENGDILYHKMYPDGVTIKELKDNEYFVDLSKESDKIGDIITIKNYTGEQRKLCSQSLSNGMVLIITVPENEINAAQNQLILYYLLAMIVILVFAAVVTLIFTSVIVKPIKHLTEVSKKIAAGQLDVEIECNTKDEIGILAARYSDTVKMLKKYIDKINKQAYTDAATDVGNKAAYQNEVQRIEKMRNHSDGDYAVFVMDINYLKMYNDKYGHEFGDMLISDASSLIKHTFEEYNIYRIGGDEFAVIIYHPEDGLCERLTKEFKSDQELFNRNAKRYELGVHVAIGYAVNSSADSDYIDVFKRADKQMYLDKQEIKKTTYATDYIDNR